MILRVFPDAAALSKAAAARIGEEARRAVRARGEFRWVLAGGVTPKAVYFLLARPEHADFPWTATRVFWGDERYVPPESGRSNERMARDILLSRVPVPESQVHPMSTDGQDPEADARRYEGVLRRHAASARGEGPDFDLALMGLGADGHTASLFPGSPAALERRRWVRAHRAAEPRLSLTLPALSGARRALFLVCGKSKAEALKELLRGELAEERFPAKGVRPREGEAEIFADAEAAAGL